MGANVGTTLGNGLIALPLGPLGLLVDFHPEVTRVGA
jgi:Na+/phosphate symporter